MRGARGLQWGMVCKHGGWFAFTRVGAGSRGAPPPSLQGTSPSQPGRARGGASAPRLDLRSHPRCHSERAQEGHRSQHCTVWCFSAVNHLSGKEHIQPALLCQQNSSGMAASASPEVLGAQPGPVGSEQLSVHNRREAQGMESLPLPCAWLPPPRPPHSC